MSTPPFRANPSSTIRLQAATGANAAPLLPGLAAGGGSDVLIVNRGSVPVLVEFGAKATMALPTAPTDTVAGSQSIPPSAAVIQRLQTDQRHVAVAVLSGVPDIEFTVGQGSSGVYGIGGSGSGGGSSAAGSVTPAGTNGTQAQAIQGINNGVPVPVTPAAPDASITTFNITGTGPTVGVPLKDYGSVLVEVLSGSFTTTAQVSTNSTNGSDGDWITVFGYPSELPSSQLGQNVQSGIRRIYPAALGAWIRLNTTAVTTAGTAAITRRVAPYAERSVYVANASLALGGGTNVIGGVQSASTFSEAFRTALAANATSTGATRDLGATVERYARFGAVAVSDQSGSLQIQTSTDGANWITVATQAVAANTPVDISVPIRARYHRAVFINGATATGASAFSLLSSFTAG